MKAWLAASPPPFGCGASSAGAAAAISGASPDTKSVAHPWPPRWATAITLQEIDLSGGAFPGGTFTVGGSELSFDQMWRQAAALAPSVDRLV
jgi:hypothetical protein